MLLFSSSPWRTQNKRNLVDYRKKSYLLTVKCELYKTTSSHPIYWWWYLKIKTQQRQYFKFHLLQKRENLLLFVVLCDRKLIIYLCSEQPNLMRHVQTCFQKSHEFYKWYYCQAAANSSSSPIWLWIVFVATLDKSRSQMNNCTCTKTMKNNHFIKARVDEAFKSIVLYHYLSHRDSVHCTIKPRKAWSWY